MRIKWGAVVVVISCMATALAMAISGQDNNSSDIVGAVEKNHSSANHTATGQNKQTQTNMHFDLSEIKRTVPDKIRTSSMFQSKSWYVSPPSMKTGFLSMKSASVLPPPPPSAPQMPFTFIGRMIDGHEVTLYLSKNNQQYSAKLNDVLDGNYRVDKITYKSAVLTYLPLNIQQELLFNSTAIGISALSASASDAAIQPSTLTAQQIEIPR